MNGDIENEETAEDVAREYADEDCVGELGEVLDVQRDDTDWIVEFRTHTFSDSYDHRVRISQVGNVYAHERADRLDSQS